MKSLSGFYKKHKREIVAYSLMAVPILWWCVFFLFAFFRSIFFSFTDMRFSVENITRFDFDNYVRLFQDQTFYRALLNTGIWTLAMTVANNLFGIFAAFFVFKAVRGRRLFLALLFWPSLVSAVTGAQITKSIFNPSDTGVANVILVRCFNLQAQGWYNDPNLALFTLMIMPFLFGFSLSMMIFYVALVGVPSCYAEAAFLETKSQFAVFRYVYFPLILNALSLNLLLSIISNIKVMGPMQLIGDGLGGPLDSTQTLMLFLYNKGIAGFEMGYACAVGAVVRLIILALSAVQQKLTGKAVEYE